MTGTRIERWGKDSVLRNFATFGVGFLAVGGMLTLIGAFFTSGPPFGWCGFDWPSPIVLVAVAVPITFAVTRMPLAIIVAAVLAACLQRNVGPRWTWCLSAALALLFEGGLAVREIHRMTSITVMGEPMTVSQILLRSAHGTHHVINVVLDWLRYIHVPTVLAGVIVGAWAAAVLRERLPRADERGFAGGSGEVPRPMSLRPKEARLRLVRALGLALIVMALPGLAWTGLDVARAELKQPSSLDLAEQPWESSMPFIDFSQYGHWADVRKRGVFYFAGVIVVGMLLARLPLVLARRRTGA